MKFTILLETVRLLLTPRSNPFLKVANRRHMMLILILVTGIKARAQVNSGSSGADGSFNPTVDTVIDMNDHPDGIYRYTSVNIPPTVTVKFVRNVNNAPVTWLVQSNCVINGLVDVSGQDAVSSVGGAGGPGGWDGGSGGAPPSSGQGPGGGLGGLFNVRGPSDGSYGTRGQGSDAGTVYGNLYLLPLYGGSGGGGSNGGGGGGGGAILIAASGSIAVTPTNGTGAGAIVAKGGSGGSSDGASGSGGGIRLIAASVTGSGALLAAGGTGNQASGGQGRVRIDAFQNSFGGNIEGVWSQGFQPIIIPVAGQGVQLSIASIGGVTVPANPSGQLLTPDSIISGQQTNPIPVVVSCVNIPLNTPITVNVTPRNGAPVSAVGYNVTGSSAASTATVSLIIPRGGGLIYATAAVGN